MNYTNTQLNEIRKTVQELSEKFNIEIEMTKNTLDQKNTMTGLNNSIKNLNCRHDQQKNQCIERWVI